MYKFTGWICREKNYSYRKCLNQKRIRGNYTQGPSETEPKQQSGVCFGGGADLEASAEKRGYTL